HDHHLVRWRQEPTGSGAEAALHASDSPLDALEVLSARTTEEGLLETTRRANVHGIIVARESQSEGFALVHLGRTARTLLHHCNVPLAIVPPDLNPHLLESGPIVVATDLTDGCLDATRYAMMLGRIFHR